MFVDRFISYIKKIFRERKWRKINPNNTTYPVNVFDFKSVVVGDYTYGDLIVLNFGGESKLYIGSFCSIASGVVFNLAGDHYLNHVSSFPFKAKALSGQLVEAISRGDIIVEDDVWIGQNSIIMSGLTIGQGAVIAAGAVVTSNVPPYAVVGGIPARVLKYRFDKDKVDYLKSLDYKKLSKEMIEKNIESLYTPIDSLTVSDIKMMFRWFPKRVENDV